MEKSPYSDVVSWTNIIVGYFEIGEVDSVVGVFDLMQIQDATAYNVTIFGLGENDCGEEDITLFIGMKESGPLPDKATFTSILAICSDLPAFQLVRQTYALVAKRGYNEFIAVCNAIITMCARCGNIDSALLEFFSMSSHDIISWNSIICGFAHHGSGGNALAVFQKMRSEGIKPNHITFVGVLSACSHAGMVDLGRYLFHMMRHGYFIQPRSEHCTCLVDLLGRCGLVEEAVSLLDQIRACGTVPANVWGAFLGTCGIHKNIEVNKIARERILEMEPCNSGVYLISAEMYRSCGKRKDAESLWTRMNAGIKKQPGCSWIGLNDSNHAFLSGDDSNPQFSCISSLLELLQIEMETKSSKSVAASFQQVLLDGCYG